MTPTHPAKLNHEPMPDTGEGLVAEVLRLRADLSAARSELAQARAMVCELRSTIENVVQFQAFSQSGHATLKAILAKTSADYSGKSVVDAAELEALRKDRERLDWLFNDGVAGTWVYDGQELSGHLGDNLGDREALDAAIDTAAAPVAGKEI